METTAVPSVDIVRPGAVVRKKERKKSCGEDEPRVRMGLVSTSHDVDQQIRNKLCQETRLKPVAWRRAYASCTGEIALERTE